MGAVLTTKPKAGGSNYPKHDPSKLLDMTVVSVYLACELCVCLLRDFLEALETFYTAH